MDDYKDYLAQQILTEDKLVTYRLLSRALKVHVNTAKEMLYEFHKWQNDKRPGSLHATYIVYGTQRKAEQDGDIEMTDSNSESGLPFSDEVPTKTLSLVKEEQLQELLQQYDDITSIHVYSLAPHPLKDLQLLADTAQSVLKMSLADDSSSSARACGAITNLRVRKRERKGAVAKPAQASSVVKPESKLQIKAESKAVAKEEAKPVRQGAATTIAKKETAAPALKRQGSSGGIGLMFAKQAAKPKKPTSTTTTKPAPIAKEEPSPAMSEDEEDDYEMPDVKRETEGGKSRDESHADLRRMMEQDDDEEPEAAADSPQEDPMEEEPSPVEPEPKAEDGPAEIVSSTGDGRRRGRRRVMKKKQIMDEQGYLVTIQEQGWESFSEDEAPPPKQQPKVEKATLGSKPKKPAGKGAQGNIMSFFAKK